MEALKYSVKTPVFEGPLDLLLDLIEKRKLFVSDVSLSQVTDDFIAYIESHEEFPISESAEFIVVASTLMLLKSRSLLPSLELTEEEEGSIEDLERRLKIYARVKELSVEIRKIFGKQIIFEKLPSKKEVIVFSPDKKTTVADLSQALLALIEALPKKEAIPKAVVMKMITLEETIEKLSERISRGIRMNFNDFAQKHLGAGGKLTHEKKVLVIVGFLAMLELVKRGTIRVTQEGKNIEMETEVVGLPNYA